jgi:predicted small metal-binding protein
MPGPGAAQYTNRCACGWEIRGTEDTVVAATIDHGRRIHNMEASREQVLAALRASGQGADGPDPSPVVAHDPPMEGAG